MNRQMQITQIKNIFNLFKKPVPISILEKNIMYRLCYQRPKYQLNCKGKLKGIISHLKCDIIICIAKLFTKSAICMKD